MAIEEVIANETNGTVVGGLIAEIGKLGLWIQGIGLVIVIWLIFQIVIAINNRIKRRTLYEINERLERVEEKIDRLLKKR